MAEAPKADAKGGEEGSRTSAANCVLGDQPGIGSRDDGQQRCYAQKGDEARVHEVCGITHSR